MQKVFDGYPILTYYLQRILTKGKLLKGSMKLQVALRTRAVFNKRVKKFKNMGGLPPNTDPPKRVEVGMLVRPMSRYLVFGEPKSCETVRLRGQTSSAPAPN